MQSECFYLKWFFRSFWAVNQNYASAFSGFCSSITSLILLRIVFQFQSWQHGFFIQRMTNELKMIISRSFYQEVPLFPCGQKILHLFFFSVRLWQKRRKAFVTQQWVMRRQREWNCVNLSSFVIATKPSGRQMEIRSYRWTFSLSHSLSPLSPLFLYFHSVWASLPSLWQDHTISTTTEVCGSDGAFVSSFVRVKSVLLSCTHCQPQSTSEWNERLSN